MKNSTTLPKLIVPIVIIYIVSSVLILALQSVLQNIHINTNVLLGSNTILFILTILCLLLHFIALKNTNPNAVIRSVMLSTLLKFMVIAIATLIYAQTAGTNKNIYAIYCAMFLYIIYTYTEVKIALKLNKSNGN